VRYDDGDEEHVVLGREQWQLEAHPPGRAGRGAQGGSSTGRGAGEGAGGEAEGEGEGEGTGEGAGGRDRGVKRGVGSGGAARAATGKGKRLADGAPLPSLADAPKLFGSAQRPGSGLSRAEQEALARQQALVGRRVEVWWPLEQ
ncbi:unnamed protein product, partial [Closterium sp. NIES-54]